MIGSNVRRLFSVLDVGDHSRLKLQPTIELHQTLIELSRNNPQDFAEVGNEIRSAVARRAILFEGQRELPVALSAILLRKPDVRLLRQLSERLHGLAERAVDWTLADAQRMERHFPEHVRIQPWFARTPGLNSWQGYSRYDAVITANGSVRFIELNTCCPAGFMHAPDSSEIILDSLKQLPIGIPVDELVTGTLERGVLVDELLALERAAGKPPQLIALLNDENELRNEVSLVAHAFRERGRDVEVANAEDLTYDGSVVRLNGRPVSLTWNKIRVSTHNSPNHCWKQGFESRYSAFLGGIRDGAMVSLNNLVAATVAEDKNLLGLMYDTAFRQSLSDGDRQFIDEYVLWTARLTPGTIDYRGTEIDLLPYLRKHRERFVIKPANEGRGFGIAVGRHTSDEDWAAACSPSADLPCVVQEYAEPIALPVMAPNHEHSPHNAGPQQMQLTIAMGIIQGKYRGLFSRVSPGPVTNVGKAGMIQAVFVDYSGPGMDSE